MFTNKFYKIRNAFHTYSRAPLATGQKWLDQATAPAGHTVSYEKVRSEDIPIISTIADRDANFLELKAGKRVTGGTRGKNYVSIIKFIDKAHLQVIPNTNGEAYIVIDENSNPIKNFIDPTDKPINQYTLSEGYEVRLLANDGETVISKNYKWTFDSFSGILHFDPEFKPDSTAWAFGEPVLEGFVYIGKTISSSLSEIKNTSNEIKDTMDEAIANAIAVQPFKFTSQQMTTVGEPYALEYSNENQNDLDFFQRLGFIIPGYVFEITSLDRDETILTEMRHLANGHTEVFLDLPWNKEYNCPIISYNYDSGQDGVGNRIPILGKYKFIATAFVMNNGDPINVKDVIDYEVNPNMVIPVPDNYELSTPYEPGVPVPTSQLPPPNVLGVGFGPNIDNSTVNVILNGQTVQTH